MFIEASLTGQIFLLHSDNVKSNLVTYRILRRSNTPAFWTYRTRVETRNRRLSYTTLEASVCKLWFYPLSHV